MSTPERLQAWVEAMERSMLAGKALVAAVKLFESGGPDVQSAWEAVEKARGAYVMANRREALLWKKAAEPDEQQPIPGIGADDPRGPKPDKGTPPKIVPDPRKALPPRSAD